MHVRICRCWVSIRDLSNLAAADLSDFVGSAVLCHRSEERVDHAVRISLSALNPETTVEEPCVCQHLPDYRMAPVVWCHLGIYCDTVIVVACLEYLRDSQHLVKGDANQVGS